MTKISTYVVDEKVTALDKWIGSDANMQNRTKNFTPKKLAAYFNEDQVINIGTPLQYKYYTLDPLEARPNGTLTFETEIGPTVNFSSITTFLLSKYTTKQNIVSDFLNFLDGSKVLLFKSSDINSFGFYRISSLEPYEPDPNFFVVTVAYETGNGALEEDEDYMISLVSLAGDFIPTKTSELINDGDDGVNPFISELDINRTEWDEAYYGKINSAEVTGTTTKTLTLTKQDGGTIEASWTDSDTGLTSVGVSMPTAFSVVNSPLTSNGTINITGAGTSLEYIKGDGTLGVFPTLTGYIPYVGATQDVDLGTHQLKADSLAVSTTSTETVDAGEIVWNAVDGTFDMGLVGGVTLQAGQELHMYGKATEAISNGQAVMFAGVQGDHILIAKADAATINANPEYLIGVATQDFVNNQFGYVTVFGNARGLDTTGYTLGSVLYYNSESSTDGLLTSTMPTAPNAKIIVAAVVRVHATQGILLVRPHTMPKLKDVQDVYAPSPSSNNGLFWNSSTLRYENDSIIGALGYTPYNATNPGNYITLVSISSTATGLTYTNTTGIFSLTSGYVIPTTTEESNWNDAYSNRITSASTPLSISSNTISISQAGSTTNGYLTSADWNTFNSKQVAGNYITSLTGEATASGPGASSVTLNNASVTAKILSGVNITGGTILDTDTMLTAFGKLQNQINSLIGGSIYQGVWNASANTPALTSSVGTDGNYYIVNVAGSTNLNGITDWKIGDWAIFHGGTWQKVDNTDAVSSVNGFAGAVSLTTDNIPEGTTNLYFTNARVSANTDVAANTALRHSPVYIGITGTINGLSIDSSQTLTLISASSTQSGALTSTDWSTFNSKQNALTNPVTGTGGNTEVAFFNSTGSTITSHPSIKIVGGQLQTASLKVSTFGAGMVYSDSIGNVGTLTGTVNELTYWSSTGTIGSLSTGAYPSLTEISYVKGVTSSIQTQLNGKQNALTNPVTGTGTTNYIPKFTGASAIGNSQIYDNGTNVGIGTTSPSFAFGSGLHVKSNSGWGEIRIEGQSFAGGTGSVISFTSEGTALADIYADTDKNLSFRTNGASERMRILANGNVGIGTTSPYSKLELVGAATSYTNSPSIVFTDNAGTADSRRWLIGNVATDYGSLNFSVSTTNSDAPTNSKMTITKSGNVGIGTTAPNRLLTVSGTQGLMSFNATSYRNTTIGSDSVGNFIVYDDTASAYRMVINSSGNVGIGTTSPRTPLEVFGNGLILSYSTSNASARDYLIATNYNAFGDFVINQANANGGNPYSAGTTRFTINASGNVGIGTTSPAAKLSVNGTLQITGSGAPSSGTGLELFYDGTGAGTLAFSRGVGYIPNYMDGSQLQFFTSSSERMRITSGGNVGIGTTSPSGKLTISGVDAGCTIDMFNTGISQKYRIVVNTLSGALAFENNAGTETVRFNQNGNVGIGTTSPIDKLNVNGGVTSTGLANPSNTAIGSFQIGYDGTNGIIRTWNSSPLIYQAYNYQSWETMGSERMRITSGGSVGIGTTSPSNLLHVKTSSENTKIARFESYNNNRGLTIGTSAEAGVNDANVVYNNLLGGYGGHIWTIADSEKMRITSDGNVGINESSPTAKLHLKETAVSWAQEINHTYNGAQFFINLKYNGTQIGSISGNNTVTAYNVTSDYRLKQDFKSFNGLDLVSKIKVYDYEWKVDNSRMNGVIAHELQEVVPYAVTGEKDAEQMQQVDYSKLVPILVQAIQELQEKINKLENK